MICPTPWWVTWVKTRLGLGWAGLGCLAQFGSGFGRIRVGYDSGDLWRVYRISVRLGLRVYLR
eukprot:457482-Amorphochlora_amoeboformis.AAC.1